MLGTFATYHRKSRTPTDGEIEAIAMITDHVADAITRTRAI